MIIFGTGKRLIRAGKPKFDCTYCGSEQSVGLHFYVRYLHIFWIPMFSYRTESLSHCTHCRQTLSRKEMPLSLAQSIPGEKPSIPWKYFSGLLLGVILIVFISIAIVNEDRQTANYLQRPQVGDVYGIKQSNGFYTLYLLSQFKGDSLGFRVNDYEVPGASKLSVIRRHHAKDYGKSIVFLSKTDLNELMKNNHIINIRRD